MTKIHLAESIRKLSDTISCENPELCELLDDLYDLLMDTYGLEGVST